MKFGTLDPKDPLTLRIARHPHEHATPADYAKSVEPHEPELFEVRWWDDLTVAVSLVAIAFVFGLILFEKVTR